VQRQGAEIFSRQVQASKTHRSDFPQSFFATIAEHGRVAQQSHAFLLLLFIFNVNPTRKSIIALPLARTIRKPRFDEVLTEGYDEERKYEVFPLCCDLRSSTAPV
jgi:hypothetical protein